MNKKWQSITLIDTPHQHDPSAEISARTFHLVASGHVRSHRWDVGHTDGLGVAATNVSISHGTPSQSLGVGVDRARSASFGTGMKKTIISDIIH